MRCLLIIALALLLSVVVARADQQRPNYDFALWLARVAANEGALWDRREMDLIWQTVQENGDDDPADWLRRHSPRVHRVPGMKPCRPERNCWWTRWLNRAGTRPQQLDVSEDYWRVVMQPAWFDILDYADWLVSGGAYNPPCWYPPRTWGNAGDAAGAARRGLYPIGCGTLKNDGYAYLPPEWSISIPYSPVEVACLK